MAHTTPLQSPSPVYLLELSIENLRCFGPRQSLDLSDGDGRPARWTVILGDNGTGKTTLLQVIAGMEPVSEKNTGIGNLCQPLAFSPQFKYSSFPSARDQTQGLAIDIGFYFGSLETRSRTPSPSMVMGLRRDSANSISPIDYLRVKDWRCIGYGALRRSGRETRLSQDDTGSNSETLFSDEAELISAEEWLLQADYAAAKDTRKESTAAKRLSLIKSTLIDLLPTVSDIDILSPDDEHEVPLVVFKNADGWIPFSCLGLGHRTMIAWVVDLAARMLRRYPDSPNPIAEPAVVLIDEIDLHLHPSWQRTLMRYLSERFKNTQFIVTAHSPLVVQAATGANIAVLRRKDKHVIIDQSLKSVQGWRVDQLLTSDLFDLPSARSTDYDEMLSERRGLLAKPQLTASDKSRLRTLEIEADQLPSGENPTEMEANRIIGEAAKLLSGQTKARS